MKKIVKIKREKTARKKTASKAVKAKAKPVPAIKTKKESSLKHKPLSKKKPGALPQAPIISITATQTPLIAPKPTPATVSKPIPTPVPKPVPAPALVSMPKPAPATPLPLKPKIEEKVVQLKDIELELPITVKDLAIRLQEKPSLIIKALMDMRVMAGINQTLSEDVVVKICEKYHCSIKKSLDKEEVVLLEHQKKDLAQDLIHRPPIVTFMGHVDHGKTSLLDAVRKTKVVESEHGGITQHIGAYQVVLAHGRITFLDTPGHEAFTAMRSRGASITDIVVLVVAADDGIMPQTEEAIDHARAAGVPIIVALNKVDKPQADIDRVKKQLMQFNLVPEDWGGKTITVPVSAKTGKGIDDLLEMILLEAQMLELKANPKRLARGVVIEARMEKGRGPVVTLLVQNGTLSLNDNIILGNLYGKIKAMFDDHAEAVISAGPAFPVEVLGITGIPAAGEQFFALKEEREAKELVALRLEKEKQQQLKTVKRVSLEDLHAQIAQGKIKELKLIIKADVQGSLEAIKDTLNKLNVSEIKLDIIHNAVGNINSSDVILAVASNALILGFNVAADERAKELVAKEGVDVRTYNIIYELANDIKAAVEGMLEPKIKKVFLGRAEIRKVFKLSTAGTVAGCFVTKGKINRNALVNLNRNGQIVFEGKLSSLKRFKDDSREVQEGFECGMSIAGFDQIQEGDIIEAYEIEKIARKL